MERIIDLSLRHKDRLMAGLWLMKIIMLLKLKFFSPFSPDPFDPFALRSFWPLLSNVMCDLLHLCFRLLLFFLKFIPQHKVNSPGVERERESGEKSEVWKEQSQAFPTLFLPVIYLRWSDFTRCNFRRRILLARRATLCRTPPQFKSSVKPPFAGFVFYSNRANNFTWGHWCYTAASDYSL